MNEKKQDVRPRTFGLSLLLMVFLVLCLLTFSAISIVEARNDLTGAEKKWEKTLAYNAAEDEAELAIAEYTWSANLERETAEETLDFSVSIDENNALRVQAVLQHDAELDEYYYTITRWQVEGNTDLILDHAVDVLPDGRIGW